MQKQFADFAMRALSTAGLATCCYVIDAAML